MAFARVNGVVLHHRVSGRGRRVVFLNSLGSDMRIWDAVLERLGPGFECLLYDMRGHGLSEAPDGPYALDDLSADVLALMDRLGWARADFVGLSVGGMVAQDVAARHPERVASLALLDTAARIGTPEMWNARIAAVEADGVASIAPAILERWFTPDFARCEPDPYAGWLAMLSRTLDAGYAGTCAAIRDADLSDGLAAIRAPTLVLAGADDRSTPPELVRETAERIRGARFVIVEGAGHLPPVERPLETAALLLDHLSRAEPDAGSRFDRGMIVRRRVLGDAHVDRAGASATPFDAAFQRFITEGAWGTVWAGDALSLRERSLLTIALLAALGQDEEVAMHVRATRRTGASERDVAEALMHVAVYAGVPAANHAIKIAKRVFGEAAGEEERA